MLYILRAGASGPYKIGYTNQTIDKRVSAIQTSHHEEIDIIFTSPVCGKAMEENLHREFKRHRIRGEWFDLSDSDVQKITRRLEPYSEARRIILECQEITGGPWEVVHEKEPFACDHIRTDDWSEPPSPRPDFEFIERLTYRTYYERSHRFRIEFAPVWWGASSGWCTQMEALEQHYGYRPVRCSRWMFFRSLQEAARSIVTCQYVALESTLYSTMGGMWG